MFKLLITVVRNKNSNDGGCAVSSNIVEFSSENAAEIAYKNVQNTFRVSGDATIDAVKLY